MRSLVAAAFMAAMPASAQPDAFDVTLHCRGPLPEFIEIVALKPGALMMSLRDMMDACMAAAPEKSRWRYGS